MTHFNKSTDKQLFQKSDMSPSDSFSTNCSGIIKNRDVCHRKNFRKYLYKKSKTIVDEVCVDTFIDGNIGDVVAMTECEERHNVKLGDKIESGVICMPYEIHDFKYLDDFHVPVENQINYDSVSRHFHSMSNQFIETPQLFFTYLITGIPRCIYDLNLFTFDDMTCETFYDETTVENPITNPRKHLKYVCYLGFEKQRFCSDLVDIEELIEENRFSNIVKIYYVKQTCPYVESFQCWKKLVVYWPAVDKVFHKSGKINDTNDLKSFNQYLHFLYNGDCYNIVLNEKLVKAKYYSKPFRKTQLLLQTWKSDCFNKYITQGAYRLNLEPYSSTCFDLSSRNTNINAMKDDNDPFARKAICTELQTYFQTLKDSGFNS